MSKTIAIAFASGGIIPAAVVKKPTDLKVPPHKAVDVPEVYGKQLIKDRIAYDPGEKAKADKQAAEVRAARAGVAAEQRAGAKDLADLTARLEAAEKSVADGGTALDSEKKRSADLEAQLAGASKQIEDGKSALDAANKHIADLEAQLAEATKPADAPKDKDNGNGDGK